MSSWSPDQPDEGTWCWVRFRFPESPWRYFSNPCTFAKGMSDEIRNAEFEFSPIVCPDKPFPPAQEELKPCICGDKDIYIRQSYETEISCSNPACGWLVRAFRRDEAIMMWNRRPNS